MAAASPAPTAGQKEAMGKPLPKKKKKNQLVTCSIGMEQCKAARGTGESPASPDFTSELYRNTRLDHKTKQETPGPEAATEGGGSKCAKEVCKLTWPESQASSSSPGTPALPGDTGEAPSSHIHLPQQLLGTGKVQLCESQENQRALGGRCGQIKPTWSRG